MIHPNELAIYIRPDSALLVRVEYVVLRLLRDGEGQQEFSENRLGYAVFNKFTAEALALQDCGQSCHVTVTA